MKIPLFHVINARITFSYIKALYMSVEGVTSLSEDTGRSIVAIDDAVFAAPKSYDQLGAGDGTENTMAHRMFTGGENSEQVDIWEALPQGQSRVSLLVAREERLLQQAIEVREQK